MYVTYIVLCRTMQATCTHYWACTCTCRLQPPDFRDMENRKISHVLGIFGKNMEFTEFHEKHNFYGENFEVWKIQF